MNAARRTEAMLDDVLVEQVRARIRFRRQQLQLLAWHEPQQRAAALANGAVARHGAFDITFHLERDVAAVTTSFVFHASSPSDLLRRPRPTYRAPSGTSKPRARVC